MKKIVYIISLFTFILAYNLLTLEKKIILHSESKYKLSDNFVISNSLFIIAQDDTLELNKDYFFDFTSSTLSLSKSISNSDTLKIFYREINFPLEKNNIISTNELFNKSTSESTNIPEKNDKKLMISGDKSFNIFVNGKDDITLEQGVNIGITGKINENYSVEGYISDSSTKFSNSQYTSLRIGNKNDIYLKIYNNEKEFYLGDKNYELNKGSINYQNSLRGVFSDMRFKKDYETHFSYAATKFKKSSLRLDVIDGFQGYYQLQVTGESVNITILPNSEKSLSE